MQVIDKVAIVTGAGRGIGAAIAKALASAGTAVIINYLSNKQKAFDVLDTIQDSGGKGIVVQADVSNPRDVDRMMAIALDQFGKIDILVNNAHRFFVPKSFLKLTWEDFQSQVDVTLKAIFHCCQAVLPGMITRRWGRIINIGSISVDYPEPGFHASDTAKAGILGLTRCLALEVSSSGITVNVVSPGWTLTEKAAKFPADLKSAALKRTPLGRLATPEDITGAVVFLASDAASFITGACLPVCGGAVMK